GTSNIFDEENRIEVELKYSNLHGAVIYQDGNGNYYYHGGDVPGIAQELVNVYYNSDCYVDIEGTQYHVVEDFDSIDEFEN
ncbi:hypothetical protein GOP47_0002450, partial [Adiantum capillus-veneris]